MKFTENMNVTGGYCSPHRILIPITARNQPCPDPSRLETARGEVADQVISEAITTGRIEWIEITSECGEQTVVNYVRRIDPDRMPAPVIIEQEKKDERKVKVEVHGI